MLITVAQCKSRSNAANFICPKILNQLSGFLSSRSQTHCCIGGDKNILLIRYKEIIIAGRTDRRLLRTFYPKFYDWLQDDALSLWL
jgi:hypothetical protein